MTTRVRFGPFEADVETGELWKGDTRLRVQEQPFPMRTIAGGSFAGQLGVLLSTWQKMG